jgi:hypothetical protein
LQNIERLIIRRLLFLRDFPYQFNNSLFINQLQIRHSDRRTLGITVALMPVVRKANNPYRGKGDRQMKNTVKYLAIMVVVLTVSSALFAAPGGNSANCSTKPGTETAIWAAKGQNVSSDAVDAKSSCNTSAAGNPKLESGSHQQHGLGNAFGKLIHSIGASIDTAIWGGGGYVPPR